MHFLRSLMDLALVLASFAMILTTVACDYGPQYQLSASKASITSRVERILERTPLIDGHNDLAIFMRYSYNNHIYGSNFTVPFEAGNLGQHTDLARLKKGHVRGSFWCAFAFCWANETGPSDQYYAQGSSRGGECSNQILTFLALAETSLELDTLKRLQQAYPDSFALVGDSEAALNAAQSGKIASPLCVEGLHLIGNSSATLRHFYSVGVRYITLTHNCHNLYADAAMVDLAAGGSAAAKPYWHGISPAGREIVEEMNRLGMLVDLSHVSVDTMRDALGASPKKGWTGSLAPVIFSHSSAYAICPHPRNVPDEILHLVKERDSLVMVTFATDFLSCETPKTPNDNGLPNFVPENSTIAQVVRHIKYIGDLIGYDHVGLGSDFDGIFDVPRGLEDVSKFPDLVAEMLQQGISDEEAEKVIGGNILRVWGKADEVAKKLQQSGKPALEDELPWLKRPGEK